MQINSSCERCGKKDVSGRVFIVEFGKFGRESIMLCTECVDRFKLVIKNFLDGGKDDNKEIKTRDRRDNEQALYKDRLAPSREIKKWFESRRF